MTANNSDSENQTTPAIFLTEKELGIRQKRSIKTLQNQRVSGTGIPYVKLGRSIRYRLSDVEEWEAARVRTSTTTH